MEEFFLKLEKYTLIHKISPRFLRHISRFLLGFCTVLSLVLRIILTGFSIRRDLFSAVVNIIYLGILCAISRKALLSKAIQIISAFVFLFME